MFLAKFGATSDYCDLLFCGSFQKQEASLPWSERAATKKTLAIYDGPQNERSPKVALLPKRYLREGDWGRLRWHQRLNAHVATQRADLEGTIFPSISSKSLIPKSRIGHWMTEWGAIPHRTKSMFPMLARDSSQGLQRMFWWDLVMSFVSSKSA